MIPMRFGAVLVAPLILAGAVRAQSQATVTVPVTWSVEFTAPIRPVRR